MAAYCESAAEAVASIEHEGAGAVERAGHHGRAGAVRALRGAVHQGGQIPPGAAGRVVLEGLPPGAGRG